MDLPALGESLLYWYKTGIFHVFESDARLKRRTSEKLTLQSDHEQLIGLLTQEGIDTDAPIADILAAIEKKNNSPLVPQFREQWSNYIDCVYLNNQRDMESRDSEDPGFFQKWTHTVTFADCFRNPFWAACSRSGVADVANVRFPVLCKHKSLRPRQETKGGFASSAALELAPREEDVIEFVNLLLNRAKHRAKHEELQRWFDESLTPKIRVWTELVTKARDSASQGVKDDTRAPDAVEHLEKLVAKTKQDWADAFPDIKQEGKEVAEALATLEKESSELQAKNNKLLTSTPETLQYLSDYLTYVVASTLEDLTRDTAASVDSVRVDLKVVHESRGAEERICLDLDGVSTSATGQRNRKRPKRSADAKEADPEHRDVRGVYAWTIRLDRDVRERQKRLRDSMPLVAKFEKARDAAFSYAVALDYANWVRSVLALVNPQATILDASRAIQPRPTYIQWMQKHEAQARDKAAIEVDTQRKNLVKISDAVVTRLNDMKDWYHGLLVELKAVHDSTDRGLLAIHKPWNEKPIDLEAKRQLRIVFAEQIKSKPGADHMPSAPMLLNAIDALVKFILDDDLPRAANYRAMQPLIETYLLGVMAIWLYDR